MKALLSVALVLGGCASGDPAGEPRIIDDRAVTIEAGEVAAAKARAASPSAREAMNFNAPPSLWGRLVITAQGERRFAPCASPGLALPIGRAAEDELARWLPVGAAEITVLGRVAQDRLEEVRYATLEGRGCARVPIEGDLRAQGNEPFWSLEIDATAARVRTPDRPDGVAYAAGAWSRGARWRYEAQPVDGGRARLILELDESRCTDSMSGALYPLRAVLMHGGQRLQGCALEGARTETARSGR